MSNYRKAGGLPDHQTIALKVHLSPNPKISEIFKYFSL